METFMLDLSALVFGDALTAANVLDCLLEVGIRKVLQPATSAQGFLGFLVSKSESYCMLLM
jgi:hypothetical protein